MTLRDLQFVVGGNEIGSGIRGLLGNNILANGDTEFDLAQGVVRLVFPRGECKTRDLVHWAGEARILEADLEMGPGGDDESILVAARIHGQKVRALLDTGAVHTSIDWVTARRAGIREQDMVLRGRTGGAGQGSVRSWMATLPAFDLGGQTMREQRVQVDEVEHDAHQMLLGLDYFLSHRIYVSRRSRKFYATWNGDPAFATADSPPANSSSGDDADALMRRAAAAQWRGDEEQAIADLDRVLAQNPNAGGALLARARLLAATGKPQSALADLNVLLRLDEGRAEARLLRADVQRHLGRRDAALADLQLMDGALAPSAALRQEMGELFGQLDLLPEASRQWDLWMDSHRGDHGVGSVLNSRCWLRTRLGQQLSEAERDCKLAIEIDGEMGHFHDSLGWLQLRLEDARGALRAFNRSLDLQKDRSAWSLYGRALAKRRLGLGAAAARDLEAARQLRPDIDDEVKKAGFAALI